MVKELLRHPELEKSPVSTINRSPIHLAAIRGHVDILRALSDAGAPVDIRDVDENTPLHYASEYGHADCIIFLAKEAQADVFVKNKFGLTPSDIA